MLEPETGQRGAPSVEISAVNGSTPESARLAAIVQHSHDAIIGKDLSGTITSWNPAAERIYGYTAAEAIGCSISIIMPPERAHEQEDLCARIAASEQIESLQTERIRKDGSRVMVSVSVSPIRDCSGLITGAASIERDITDSVRHEQELARAQLEVQQSAERQRRLMSEVLMSVTGGKLSLCFSENDLPEPLPLVAGFDQIAPDSLREFRRLLEAVALERSFPDERWEDLITAAGEAAMNAVVHAGGGKCRIHCGEDTIQVWVEDSGTGIDISHIHRATLEGGYTTGVSFGHGFSLMLRTADRIWLLTSQEGTRVVLSQGRRKPEPTWFQAYEVLREPQALLDASPLY